jgi:hypothetical protein
MEHISSKAFGLNSVNMSGLAQKFIRDWRLGGEVEGLYALL